MATCLLVDDDPALRDLTAQQLARYGLHVRTASDLRGARQELGRGGIDLMLLDLMLPDGNGLELCRQLRQQGGPTMPIIMLTAQGDPISRIVGLELGADDYVAKPFEPRELVARVQAVLRRTQSPPPPASPAAAGAVTGFGEWRIDWRAHLLQRGDGVSLPLSNAECRLLGAFTDHPGEALSRARLVELTRAAGGEVSERSVDLAVSRLRQKLGDSAEQPTLIVTVRGLGYRFDMPPGNAASGDAPT